MDSNKPDFKEIKELERAKIEVWKFIRSNGYQSHYEEIGESLIRAADNDRGPIPHEKEGELNPHGKMRC